MDTNTRASGLDELFSVIYGDNTHLSTVLQTLGFEPTQIQQLQNGRLESVSGQFLDAIHRHLTNHYGRDTYYKILSRHYGLDGEPRQPLSAIAESYGFRPEYLYHLLEEIIERCRSKTWQTELKKSWKYIVMKELGQTDERPTGEHVAEKLERLSNLRNAAEFTRLHYETKRRELLKQIQLDLDALDAEYRPVLDAAQEHLAALENEIRTDVLLYGESVSGGRYHACYTHGQVSWDQDGVEEYSKSHPEILQFRKQAQPIVFLRVVGTD